MISVRVLSRSDWRRVIRATRALRLTLFTMHCSRGRGRPLSGTLRPRLARHVSASGTPSYLLERGSPRVTLCTSRHDHSWSVLNARGTSPSCRPPSHGLAAESHHCCGGRWRRSPDIPGSGCLSFLLSGLNHDFNCSHDGLVPHPTAEHC